MLISLIVSGSLWLPELSVAAIVMPWPAPSCKKVTGAGQDATPDRSSVQLNVRVTGPLFQPFGLGAGVRVSVIMGGVLSEPFARCTETVFTRLRLPALSMA